MGRYLQRHVTHPRGWARLHMGLQKQTKLISGPSVHCGRLQDARGWTGLGQRTTSAWARQVAGSQDPNIYSRIYPTGVWTHEEVCCLAKENNIDRHRNCMLVWAPPMSSSSICVLSGSGVPALHLHCCCPRPSFMHCEATIVPLPWEAAHSLRLHEGYLDVSTAVSGLGHGPSRV